MAKYNLTREDFFKALDSCFDYVSEGDDPADMTRGYMNELTKVINSFHRNLDEKKYWATLYTTGVFHDSEGKVVEVTDTYVRTTTTY